MTYIEESFYKKDEKKYELRNNKEFLSWLINSMDDGVKPSRYTKIEDFEGLIDSIVAWYELKYPGYFLNPPYANPLAERLRDVRNISKYLDGKQFLFRLPFRQHLVMDVRYGNDNGTNGSGNYFEWENGRKVAKGYISINLPYKKSSVLCNSVLFDPETGIVNSGNKEFIGLDLDSLLLLIKRKYKNIFDYSNLEIVVKQYYFDLELRHRILQLAALKILYKSESRDMGFQTPYMGYIRAKNFINEFNEDFGLLLSFEEIDNLFGKFVLEDSNVKTFKKSLN